MFRSDLQLALDRDQNQLSVVSSYQVDDFMEKLKLLNFERLLLKEMKMKPTHKYYFVKSVNPGEQFYMFVSICAWLIRKTGRDFVQPQEYDDPNAIISKIVQTLRDLVSEKTSLLHPTF
jgi:intraflagellar transport protein 57